MSSRKIALLSNITVDLVAAKLHRKYDFYIPEGYDTWVQEAIDPASGLYSEEPDGIIILLDGTEARSWRDERDAEDRISLWKQAVNIILERAGDIPVFVSTIDFRLNRIRALAEMNYTGMLAADWCSFIMDTAGKRSNLYALDIADLIADIGRREFYSDKMWYMSSMPYSRTGLASVAEEIDRVLRSAFDSRRKIIVLDLDNTLWGGVIGEDGVDGIELSNHKGGQRFYDFQRQLLEMKNRGIVLAVNSKNNKEDADAAIDGHPSMLLRSSDFVLRKINWNNKASNIKEMEQELNISEGGFVFIDDNPVEREVVGGECPEVLVPEFPSDTTALISFAEALWKDELRPLRVLAEDAQKTKMYQSDAGRKHEKELSLNLDDYIARLEISADIHRMRPEELDRVAQLCGKTNQFNVTTKRYTRTDIETIASDSSNAIYVVHSSDKYGDNGLISVIILMGEGDDVRIDTFLMSCRVMGRKLENVILQELTGALSSKARLLAEYIPTAKNKPVEELYDRLGFRLVSEEEGHRMYELMLNSIQAEPIKIYKEIKFEN